MGEKTCPICLVRFDDIKECRKHQRDAHGMTFVAIDGAATKLKPSFTYRPVDFVDRMGRIIKSRSLSSFREDFVPNDLSRLHGPGFLVLSTQGPSVDVSSLLVQSSVPAPKRSSGSSSQGVILPIRSTKSTGPPIGRSISWTV